MYWCISKKIALHMHFPYYSAAKSLLFALLLKNIEHYFFTESHTGNEVAGLYQF